MRDISNRRIIEERTEKNTSIFDLLENHSGIAIVKVDAKLHAEYVSPSMYKVLGYPPEYFIGNSVMDVVHEEDRPGLEELISRKIEERATILENEYRVRTKSNRVLWVETKAHLFYDNRGEFDGAVYIQSDISGRKQQEHQLEAALREKELLMKELNHRVKNNLAMVSSLIGLKELETGEDLSDLKNRIGIIKLIHEKLHHHNDVERIEIKAYFQELLEAVFASISGRKVEIINTCEEVPVLIKTAAPLGFLVNEIATNAVKHGFTYEKEPRFTVELKWSPEEEQYTLTLANNGNPFPEEAGFDHPQTIGLQLASTLVSQLNGTIEVRKSPQPVFTIRIPQEEITK